MHQLCVGEQTVNVTEAQEVISFNEKEVKLRLKNGRKITLTGDGFKITSFNEQNGNLTVSGKVSSIKYSSDENFVKRLFK